MKSGKPVLILYLFISYFKLVEKDLKNPISTTRLEKDNRRKGSQENV